MAKFFGMVGYVELTEARPGVWKEEPKEFPYYGDVLRNTRRLDAGDGANDSPMLNNSISVIADAYAYEHYFAIRYVRWMGAAWKVTNVEVQRPRLLLTIGGLYHGDKT